MDRHDQSGHVQGIASGHGSLCAVSNLVSTGNWEAEVERRGPKERRCGKSFNRLERS